jgi:hypothetical protein
MVSRIKKFINGNLKPILYRSEKENLIFLNMSVFSQAPLGREGAQIKEIFRTKQKNVYISLIPTESITFLCSTANATEAKDHGELDQHDVLSP